MATKNKLGKKYDINYECDRVSLLIYCWDEGLKDVAVLFRVKHQDSEKFLFLPMKSVNKNSNATILDEPSMPNLAEKASKEDSHKFNIRSWKYVAEEMIMSMFGEVVEKYISVLYILRVYSPIKEKYFCNTILGVKVCATDIDKIHFVKDFIVLSRKQITQEDYIVERKKILWIIEELYKIVAYDNITCGTSGSRNELNESPSVTSYHGATFEEINPSVLFDDTKGCNSISPVGLFASPGYSLIDKMRLYEAFIHLSYPFSTLVFRNIKLLLKELGFSGSEKRAFRAIDCKYAGEVDLTQFVLGLTAMDPMTEHGKEPSEFRCHQIFRYYDDDEDGFLSDSDMKGMIRDILRAQDRNPSLDALQKGVENAFSVFGVDPSEKVPLPKFLISVGNLRFRGTSGLYRASSSIPVVLQKLRDRLSKEMSPRKNNELMIKNKGNGRSSFSPYSSAIVSCDGKMRYKQILDTSGIFQDVIPRDDCNRQASYGYTVAEHPAMVRRCGVVSNVSNNLLTNMEKNGEICKNDIGSLNGFTPWVIPQSIEKQKIANQLSVEAFTLKSLPTKILDWLHYFERGNEDKKPMMWGSIDKLQLSKFVHSLCDSVKDILESEPRLLHIPAPCYILGDLHGNFHNLIAFEKAIWRLGPNLTPSHFLFLGDYVDWGQQGFEVVLYLLAQKMKSPKNFHLLRGNHEVRSIQLASTFHKECRDKFGPEIGEQLWEDINQVFDRMPLAAIVDKKICCMHGGIPRMEGTLRDINNIQCPLPSPEKQSVLAWEIMWNDPIRMTNLSNETRVQLEQNKGFAFNQTRKTALFFNDAAFERFLEKNSVTHVIRAHDVKLAGFEVGDATGARIFPPAMALNGEICWDSSSKNVDFSLFHRSHNGWLTSLSLFWPKIRKLV